MDKIKVETAKDTRTEDAAMPSPEHVIFLLLEGFTHVALSSSIEALRVANLLRGRRLYSWSLMTPGGNRQKSSNDLVTLVDSDLIPLRHGTRLYVVSGLHAEDRVSPQLCSYLRQQSRHGVQMGALCSGAYVLASAGLLSGQTCAVHWEYYPMFREKFSDVYLTDEVFVARNRPYTASGGTAGAELMLHLISRKHGEAFARQIADQLVLANVRREGEVQRMPNHIRFGTRNQVLLRSLDLMTTNIEEPLTTPEIAALIGVSVRQIERVFRRNVGFSPSRCYKRLRLDHSGRAARQPRVAAYPLHYGTALQHSRRPAQNQATNQPRHLCGRKLG